MEGSIPQCVKSGLWHLKLKLQEAIYNLDLWIGFVSGKEVWEAKLFVCTTVLLFIVSCQGNRKHGIVTGMDTWG